MFEGLTPEQIALIAASLGMPKLLIKLLDVIQQGTGTISEPYFIRKKAEALADGKSYEIKKLTEAFVESQKLLPSIEYKDGQLSIPSKPENDLTLEQRYKNRFEYQQARKQLNVESVTANAVEELISDPDIENQTNQESVSQDWIARYFETIEGINDEQMQQLWGRILAGEIKRPNSFSLRTLEVLKNLSKEDADLFCKASVFLMKVDDDIILPVFETNNVYSKSYASISEFEIFKLEEMGLIGGTTFTFDMAETNEYKSFTAQYFDYIIKLIFKKNEWVNDFMGVKKLTKAGEEILTLVKVSPDLNYIEHFFEKFYPNLIKASYGRCSKTAENSIQMNLDTEKVLYSIENNTKTN